MENEIKFSFIAVEGAIGVGKTSLVKGLSSRLDAVEILEDIDNPFLRDFYEGKEGAAFQSQLFFLLSRYRQQQEVIQRNLFRRFAICDYLFAKDRIFAYLNLTDSELMIYEKVYSLLEGSIPKPELVIYLQATGKVLKERILRRNREIEYNISEEYLEEVNKAYNYYFFHYQETPLLVINTSDIDFVQREEDLDDLIRQINSMEKGTRYYVPLGS